MDRFTLTCAHCGRYGPFKMNVPAPGLGNTMRKQHRDLVAKMDGPKCDDSSAVLSIHLSGRSA